MRAIPAWTSSTALVFSQVNGVARGDLCSPGSLATMLPASLTMKRLGKKPEVGADGSHVVVVGVAAIVSFAEEIFCCT